MFKAIYSDSIMLHLITEENLGEARSMFEDFADSGYMLAEFDESYLPKIEDGKVTRYSFYAVLDNDLAGLTLLDVAIGKL
ncbi:MAG: hypothetical protein M3388_00150 [Acidobacteriota bacterium]|nr:hypothetical protein [Acidobacteriota bacterium]